MKKLYTLFLLALMPLMASAYDAVKDGIYYNLDTSGDTPIATVTYKDDSFGSYSSDVVIPESVLYGGTNYYVTSIGFDAFMNCRSLTSITIPNSVTNIEDGAFSNCYGLTSVTIPNSVTSIGYYAFSCCTGLTSITIPNSVTSIEDGAFSDCDGLTSVTIGNGVTSIGGYTFAGCSSLTSITIPNSVTSIGEYAFGGCSVLTSITIPSSVTSIGSGAFQDCSGLTSVTIPNSVTSIGERAFDGTAWYNNQPDGVVYAGKVLYKYKGQMPEGTSIDIMEGTLGITDHAFAGCSGLTSVTIPNSVTSIGGSAFQDCSGLTSVTIPNSVTSIGGSAFQDCSGLTSVTISNSVTSIGDCAFAGCSGLTSITIPNSVTSIGGSAFQNCSGLTSITIPNSVTSIGGYAFEGCSGLTSVDVLCNLTSTGSDLFKGCSNIKDVKFGCNTVKTVSSLFSGYKSIKNVTMTENVTSIENSAFSDCDGLTSVTIGNGVTSIGEYAFSGCSGLTSVTIGNSVTSIGWCAFSRCNGLTAVYITDLEAWCKINYNCIYGNTYINNPLYYAHHLYLNGEEITKLTIPNSVTSIRDCAFAGCSGLTSITIPNSVTSIDYKAFSGCSGLTSVELLCNLTSIGSDAFEYCSNITDVKFDCETVPSLLNNRSSIKKVTMTENVTSIGSYAFSGCRGLTSVTIPNSVTSIGGSAFQNCSGLTSVTIGNSVTSIGQFAFSGCSSLTSITIPNSMTSIGGYAFSGLSGLASITIPNSVTSIGGYAFSGCSGLASITIPNSVTSIDYRAFNGTAWYDNQPDGVVYAGKVLYTYKGSMLEGTNIDIEEGTLGIAEYAFSSCSGLTSVTIPNSVTSIGNYAFYRSANLSSVNSYIETPYEISESVFGSIPSATLYVPVGTKEKYEAFKGWTKFQEIVEFKLPEAKSDLTYKGTAQDLISAGSIATMQYSLDGTTYSTTVPQGTDAKEYTIYYKDNNLGIANSIKVTIAAKTVSNPTIILGQASYICNGSAIKPEVTVKDGNTAILSSEYSVGYSDNTNAGTATVTITDKEGGNYVVNGSTTFTILRGITDLFNGSYLLAGYVAQEDLALPMGLTAYIITDVGESSATASQISYIPRGIPVLLKRDNATTNNYEAAAGTGTAPATNLLKTYMTDKTVSDQEGYVLYRDEFVLVRAGTLPAGRVFLPANGSISPTRGIVFEGDGTTGAEYIMMDPDEYNEVWYDIQGRKLDNRPSKKGLYILNGRKVVVK